MILEKIKKLINIFKEKDYLKVLLLFSFLFVVLSWMYFSSERFFSNDDHFFHIRFAQIFSEKGLDAFSNFKWIYFSNIREGDFFVYYNFLFYIFLIPFTFVSPLFLGIKLAGVTIFSTSFSLLYYCFLKLKIKFPLAWVLVALSIVNEGVLGRFLNTRPFVLSPVLLIFALYLIHKKKYFFVGVFSFFYFFWHGATFFFPFVIALVYFLFDNLYSGKFNFKILMGPFFGTLVAWIATLLLFPGFGEYFGNIIGIYWETVLGKKANLNEGNELYPYGALEFVKMQLWLSSLFIVAVIFEIYQYIQLKKNKISLGKNKFYNSQEQKIKATLFFLSLGFFLGCFAVSKRYNDYFVFFSIAYLALSFSFLLKFIEIKVVFFKKAFLTSLLVLFFYLFGSNVISIRSVSQANEPFDQFEEVSFWIKSNVDSGEIIFHPTWNWFTILFYYNPDNYYLSGLEPRYMYEHNPKLYWGWRNVSEKGFLCFEEECRLILQKQRLALNSENEKRKEMWYNEEGRKIAQFIQKGLKSNYIVTSTSFFRLKEILDNCDYFEKVFEGERYSDFFVYKINFNN